MKDSKVDVENDSINRVIKYLRTDEKRGLIEEVDIKRLNKYRVHSFKAV